MASREKTSNAVVAVVALYEECLRDAALERVQLEAALKLAVQQRDEVGATNLQLTDALEKRKTLEEECALHMTRFTELQQELEKQRQELAKAAKAWEQLAKELRDGEQAKQRWLRLERAVKELSSRFATRAEVLHLPEMPGDRMVQRGIPRALDAVLQELENWHGKPEP